jgi:hypothetical protein
MTLYDQENRFGSLGWPYACRGGHAISKIEPNRPRPDGVRRWRRMREVREVAGAGTERLEEMRRPRRRSSACGRRWRLR